MKKIGSGSISQMHGSADPDPHQNVMDPQHCRESWGKGEQGGKNEWVVWYLEVNDVARAADLLSRPQGRNLHQIRLFTRHISRRRLRHALQHNAALLNFRFSNLKNPYNSIVSEKRGKVHMYIRLGTEARCRLCPDHCPAALSPPPPPHPLAVLLQETCTGLAGRRSRTNR